MEKVMLVGRAVADCEMKKTSNGNEFLSFRMVCNKPKKKNDEGNGKATYYYVSSFNSEVNNFMKQYIKKGNAFYVYGDLDVSVYEKKDERGNITSAYLNSNVNASDISFAPNMGKKEENDTNESTSTTKQTSVPNDPQEDDIDMGVDKMHKQKSAPAASASEDDDDLPF